MPETKATPKQGDPCPACGGALEDVRPATAEEYRAAIDKENPINLGPHVDVVAPGFVDDHGTLARCGRCGYRTRYAPATADEAVASDRQARAKSAAAPRANARD